MKLWRDPVGRKKEEEQNVNEGNEEREEIWKMKNIVVFISYGALIPTEILNMTRIHTSSNAFNQLLINIQGKT